jgi:hypothetical protein
MHDTYDAPHVRFQDRINKTKSIRLSSKFTHLATVGFQPDEHCTAEFITK